jgi:cytochrome b561
MALREDLRWSLAMRRIHALAAIMIVTAAAIGLAMTHLVSDIGLRFELYQWHKSFGFVVLAIMVARWVARLTVTAPVAVGKPWQHMLATLIHWFFYLALIALPLTGWAMVSASPLPVPTVLFGVLTIPNILRPDLALYGQLKALHGWLSWATLLALVLHVAGALLHQRDNILRRMWRLRA